MKKLLTAVNNLTFISTDYKKENHAIVKVDNEVRDLLNKLGKDEEWVQSHLLEDNCIDIYPLATEELGATWWDGQKFSQQIIVGYRDKNGALITLEYSPPFKFKSDLNDYAAIQNEIGQDLIQNVKQLKPNGNEAIEFPFLTKEELILELKRNKEEE